ncbi:hypothetical protein F0U63_03400 [Cystobacter fuscus]|nr:hypothetical protein F0U63_03400 [Cystobacter fuscus]
MRLLPVGLLPAVLLVGCGTTNGVGASPGAGPASGKWMGKPVPGPGGGEIQTTIYYGPWQCSQRWMNRCQRKCASQGHKLMGCIWIADIKTDWKGRYLSFPVYAGGRYAITHCCCDYPEVEDAASLRDEWTNKRDSFRRKWGEEFGGWPKSGDTHYPGHHIHDLLHGGGPIAEGNLLPTPSSVHEVLNKQYPLCYKGANQWRTVGLDRPYTD